MWHADETWLSKSTCALPDDCLKTLIYEGHYKLMYSKRDKVLFRNINPVTFHALFQRTFFGIRERIADFVCIVAYSYILPHEKWKNIFCSVLIYIMRHVSALVVLHNMQEDTAKYSCDWQPLFFDFLFAHQNGISHIKILSHKVKISVSQIAPNITKEVHPHQTLVFTI